jgi:hypothetical protein
MRDLKNPTKYTSQCRYFAGLFSGHGGEVTICKINVPYRCVETFDGKLPCTTPGITTCKWLRYRKKDTWRAMLLCLIDEAENDEREYPNWKLMGLQCNYLHTPDGTCCSKCGVLGTHFMADSNPSLYWYKGEWVCASCIPNEDYS